MTLEELKVEAKNQGYKLVKDTPVMYVEESGLLSTKPSKMFTYTGEKAERLYKELTGWAESEVSE